MSATRHRGAGIGATDRVIAVKDLAADTNIITFDNLNGEHDTSYRIHGIIMMSAASGFMALRLNNNSGAVYDHICQHFAASGHSIVDTAADTVFNIFNNTIVLASQQVLVDIKISAKAKTAGFLINCRTSVNLAAPNKGTHNIITGGSSEVAELTRIDFINDVFGSACYGVGTKLTLTAMR